MAVSPKIIKKRIRSISNTRKITKAMEMVAAVKMRKSVNLVLSSRAYAQAAWDVVLGLVKRVDRSEHALLLQRPELKRGVMILITSNRGLCGGFNSQIIAKALNEASDKNLEWDFVAVGKKGAEYLARTGKKLVAEFEKPDVFSGLNEVMPVAKMVVSDYVAGKYDKVCVAYTDYVSALIQKPKVLTLLPFEGKIDNDLGAVSASKEESELQASAGLDSLEYVFEPDKGMILDMFLPRLVEFQLYQAMLESTASDHSARMMAMKNASSSASDMINDLTLMFNQARQAGITREIAEITGSKAALE